MNRSRNVTITISFLMMLLFCNCSNNGKMDLIQKNNHFHNRSIPSKYGEIYDAKLYQSDLLLLTSTGIVRLSKDTNYNVSGSIDNSFEHHATIYSIQDDVLVTLEETYQQQKKYSFYSIKENKLIGSYVSKSDHVGDNLFLSESLSEEPVFYVLNNHVFQKINIKNNQVVWSVEISRSRVRDIFPISNHRFLFIHAVGTIEESNIVIDQKESAIIKEYPFSTLIKTNCTGFFQAINDHELLLEDFQNNHTYNLYKVTITEDSLIETKLLFEINATIALNHQNVRLIIDKQNENTIVVFFDALMDDSQKLDIQAINLKTGKIESIRKKDHTALQNAMQINNSLLYRIFLNKKTLFILNQDTFEQDQGTGVNSTLHSYLLNAITDFNDQANSRIWSVSFNSPLQQQQSKLSELNRFFFGEKYFCHLHEYGIELLDAQNGTLIQQERMRIDLKEGNYFYLYDDKQDSFIVITNNKLLLIS